MDTAVKRRDVFGILGGAVLPMLRPLPAHAADRIFRIAYVTPIGQYLDAKEGDAWRELVTAFLRGMSDLGYIEGRNMKFEFYSAEGSAEKLNEIGNRLLGTPPDVIIAAGGGANEMAHAFKRLTQTVPIVMANSSDPVEQGLVASLARPGGNISGFTGNTGPEFEAKRLQLLREVDPSITHAAYLGLKVDWESPAALGVRGVAEHLGMTLRHAEHTVSDYARAFEFISREQMHGLFVARNPWNFSNRRAITNFTMSRRMAAVYPTREFTEVEGLMSYGPNLHDLYRRAAGHVDKILTGTSMSELSVEQPTKFELVFNLKTANALGLTVPSALLARADEIIE